MGSGQAGPHVSPCIMPSQLGFQEYGRSPSILLLCATEADLAGASLEQSFARVEWECSSSHALCASVMRSRTGRSAPERSAVCASDVHLRGPREEQLWRVLARPRHGRAAQRRRALAAVRPQEPPGLGLRHCQGRGRLQQQHRWHPRAWRILCMMLQQMYSGGDVLVPQRRERSAH